MRLNKLILLLAGALLIRLVVAYTDPGAGYDIDSYRIQAQAVLNGQNIYEVTYRYPYPPLWMYVPAAAWRLADWSQIPFYFWVKLPAIAADLLIGWLLASWPISFGIKNPNWRAALYLFNPIAILISAGHGQFDSIVILFVLLAVRFSIDRHLARSALSLSVSIALKGFPVLLLPAFLIGLATWGQMMIYTILAVSILGLMVLPYLSTNSKRLIGIVLGYNSTSDHSYGYVLGHLTANGTPAPNQLLNDLRLNSRWLQASALAFTTLWGFWRKWPIEQRVTLVLLVIYVVSPGLASQQMLWILPFLILTRHRSIWVYSVISFLALVLFYWQYFPAAIYASAAWSDDQINILRLAAEGIWWLSVVALFARALTSHISNADRSIGTSA
jgi:hypothetical protein